MGQDRVTVIASQPPVYRHRIRPDAAPAGASEEHAVTIELTSAGWRVGDTTLGSGILTIQPTVEGAVAIQSQPITPPTRARVLTAGCTNFVPVAPRKFDLINEVDIDGYLAGVLPRELLNAVARKKRTRHRPVVRAHLRHLHQGDGGQPAQLGRLRRRAQPGLRRHVRRD